MLPALSHRKPRRQPETKQNDVTPASKIATGDKRRQGEKNHARQTETKYNHLSPGDKAESSQPGKKDVFLTSHIQNRDGRQGQREPKGDKAESSQPSIWKSPWPRIVSMEELRPSHQRCLRKYSLSTALVLTVCTIVQKHPKHCYYVLFKTLLLPSHVLRVASISTLLGQHHPALSWVGKANTDMKRLLQDSFEHI